MTLKELFDLQGNGALKISHEDGKDFAVMGGSTQISLEQAEQLCRKLGWAEHYLDSFEILSKTNSMINTLRKSALGVQLSAEVLANTTVEFQNKRAATYGKTFDRIVMNIKGDQYTIIHGMEHQGAPFVVYVNGSAIASAKCRTLNKVAEYLVGVV